VEILSYRSGEIVRRYHSIGLPVDETGNRNTHRANIVLNLLQTFDDSGYLGKQVFGLEGLFPTFANGAVIVDRGRAQFLAAKLDPDKIQG
jgi:hypothetical protein